MISATRVRNYDLPARNNVLSNIGQFRKEKLRGCAASVTPGQGLHSPKVR